MKKQTTFAALLTFALLAGCTASLAPISDRAAAPQAPASQRPATSNEGELRIGIRWPDRNVQAIPLSANSATVWLYDSAGRLMTQASVQRPTEGNLSSQVFFRVKATMGVRVVAKLYEQTTPSANDVPVAMGTGNVDIYANNVNFVAITMDPLIEPTLAVLTPSYGGVGKEIVISGAFLGESQDWPVTVKFTGIPATSVTRVSDEEIRATVPAGAVSGDVEVAVDGIRKTLPFEVLVDLAFENLNGQQQAYRIVPLTCIGTFTNGSRRQVDALTWSSSNHGVATVDQNGLLRPVAPGTAKITAASGGVNKEGTVTVSTTGAVVFVAVKVPQSGMGTVGVPINLPSAAPGNLPVISDP
ncbi:Ig-like domain-containing protein [bacterium]|nr:Ig-like domain-containing protein [bacterium]